MPNGEEDGRTLHGGTPPIGNGTKIAINIWIRAGSWVPRGERYGGGALEEWRRGRS